MFSARDLKLMADSELVLTYKQSEDLLVLGELYRRYMSQVFGVCLKYLKDRDESKDAVMQIFEKLITTLKKHEVANFKGWLYVSARNYCLMQLRDRKGKTFEDISPLLMESHAVIHPDSEPDMNTNLDLLEKCMQALANEQKTCVQLFFIDQKCYKEIAQTTGFDDNKVKSYIQNGKRNLKICMERNV